MAKSDRELQTSRQADQSLADEWSWHGNLYYFGAPGASSQSGMDMVMTTNTPTSMQGSRPRRSGQEKLEASASSDVTPCA